MTQAALQQQREDGWRELALSYEKDIKRIRERLHRLLEEQRITLDAYLEIIRPGKDEDIDIDLLPHLDLDQDKAEDFIKTLKEHYDTGKI